MLEDFVAQQDRITQRVRVLLADQDPISQHVLGSVLRKTAQLDVTTCTDRRQPVRRWPLNQVDVAVLATSPCEDPNSTVKELVFRRIPVLLIGIGWNRSRLDGVFAAGASGCLVKDTKVTGLGAAVRAVASGHTVLSP